MSHGDPRTLLGDHAAGLRALLRRGQRGHGSLRGRRRLEHLPLHARAEEPGAGPPVARLPADARRRLLPTDRPSARPGGRARPYADPLRLPPAARRDQHHHGRIRHLGAAVRLHLLARDVLSRLQPDRRPGRPRPDRGHGLHDVASLADTPREAGLPTGLPRRNRAPARRPRLANRGCAVPVGAAPDRAHRLSPGGRSPRPGPAALGAVVAGRLDACPGHDGPRDGRGAGGGRPARQLVVSRDRRPALHRRDPLEQGPAPARRPGLPLGPRRRGPAAPPPGAPGGRRRRRDRHRPARGILMEGPAQFRRLHQVRPLPRGMPGDRRRRAAQPA